MDSLRESLSVKKNNITKAAYIGASNGDDPIFFELFKAAMNGINLHDSRLINSSFSTEDQSFVSGADLILLAGGEVERGWNVMQNTGMVEMIRQRYVEGAVIVGVSAGAVQLGAGFYNEDHESELTETLMLVPYLIGAHDESNDWGQLRQSLKKHKAFCKGYGLPHGGGMIYHPDATLEPLNIVINEFQCVDEQITSNLLYPSNS